MRKITIVIALIVLAFFIGKLCLATTDINVERLLNSICNSGKTAIRATGITNTTATVASKDAGRTAFYNLVSSDTNRSYFYIQNKSSKDAVLVYLGDASVINTLQTKNTADACIYLATMDNARYGMSATWTMPSTAIYTGVISIGANTKNYHDKVVYITY